MVMGRYLKFHSHIVFVLASTECHFNISSWSLEWCSDRWGLALNSNSPERRDIESFRPIMLILWMEEILHHLGWFKPHIYVMGERIYQLVQDFFHPQYVLASYFDTIQYSCGCPEPLYHLDGREKHPKPGVLSNLIWSSNITMESDEVQHLFEVISLLIIVTFHGYAGYARQI